MEKKAKIDYFLCEPCMFVLFCEYILENVEKSFQNQTGNCRAGWSGYSKHTGLFFFCLTFKVPNQRVKIHVNVFIPSSPRT